MIAKGGFLSGLLIGTLSCFVAILIASFFNPIQTILPGQEASAAISPQDDGEMSPTELAKTAPTAPQTDQQAPSQTESDADAVADAGENTSGRMKTAPNSAAQNAAAAAEEEAAAEANAAEADAAEAEQASATQTTSPSAPTADASDTPEVAQTAPSAPQNNADTAQTQTAATTEEEATPQSAPEPSRSALATAPQINLPETEPAQTPKVANTQAADAPDQDAPQMTAQTEPTQEELQAALPKEEENTRHAGVFDDDTNELEAPSLGTAPQTPQADTTQVAAADIEQPKLPQIQPATEEQAADVAPEPETQTQVAAAQPDPVEAEPSQDSGQDAGAAQDQPLPAAPVVDGPAFEAFAAAFDAPASEPLLSIILQHVEGDDGFDQSSIYEMGIPITLAIDPTEAKARRIEHDYREAGFEVVAIVPDRGNLRLTQRTQLTDVEAILDEYFEAVPGAVAVIDRPLGDFYRNIRVVNVMTQSLNKNGRGLLIHERFGINAAIGSAAAKRVPVAAVKRVIDSNRSEAAIRAALDRAALEASKTGHAVVFGRTYPETVTTLVKWLLSNSARSVTLAPLTATVSRK